MVLTQFIRLSSIRILIFNENNQDFMLIIHDTVRGVIIVYASS